MKKFSIAVCLCSLFWMACNQLGIVTFKEAQPAGVKALTAFPESIQGSYISRDQRTTVSINAQRMLTIEDYDFGVAVQELDSSYVLKGDTLLDTYNGTSYRVTVKGDSIWKHVYTVDTAFDLQGKEQVAKKYKGYYFLNWGNDQEGWMVIRLSLEKGKLVFASVRDSAAIQQLHTLAEKPMDTVTYAYSISKRKFKTFNSNNGFTDADTFYRINN